jgi:tetratricopeptide (TPR) repeat protein
MLSRLKTNKGFTRRGFWLVSIIVSSSCFTYTANAQNNQTSSTIDRDKPIKIQELHFGEALYHYFLQQFPQALTRVQAGVEQKYIQHHLNDALLLDANISVNYGLFDHANQLLAQLLSLSLPEQKKQIAWLYLAKQALKYNLSDKARQALRQNSDLLNANQNSEKLYLASQLIQQNGDIDYILSQLAQSNDTQWKPYTLFNIAVAAVDQGRVEDAVEILNRQLKNEPSDAAQLLLKDRSALALGLLHLQQKQFKQALQSFKQIQLQSPLSQQAFYTYGWGLVQDQQIEAARTPWNWLVQNQQPSQWSWYSYLALAQSYENQETPDPESALAIYQLASKRMNNDNNLLNTLNQKVDFAVVSQLVAADKPLENEIGDIQKALQDNLTADSLQTALANLDQLEQIQQQLIEKERQIVAIIDTLDFRKQRRLVRLNSYLQTTSTDFFNQTANDIEHYERLLIESDQDGSNYLLATEQQIQWMRQLANARAIEAWLKQYKNTTFNQEQIRRIDGVLKWEISQSYPEQRWHTQKALIATNRVYKELLRRQSRLGNMIKDHEVNPDKVAKIKQMLETTKISLAETKQYSAQLKHELVTNIKHSIRDKQHILDSLYAQAQLAITRLRDDAFRQKLIDDTQQPAPGSHSKNNHSKDDRSTDNSAANAAGVL